MKSVSTRRQRIVLAAQKFRHEPLTALSHHMDLNWMCEAYRQVRKNAATGIDGQTVAQYGENLVENLRDLQTRAKSGSYQAPPVKRVYVPKNEKEDRPIGIPTTEDKILQRAVSMILGPICEHEVLDKWFVESVQPACQGKTFMVRYADDFVMGFERLEDVHKVQRVIAKRFARFGLEINTEKTRLVRFGRPSRTEGTGDKPETFDFLGFTHYWGKSQKGNQVVKKKTAKGRFRRTLQAIKKWGMEHRHLPMKEQQRKLNEKLRGHDGYYGVTGNIRMLSQLRCQVAKLWRRWLQRRNRSSSPNWEKFQGMLRVFPLFPARIIHSSMQ
jgi:hypothetical protein